MLAATHATYDGRLVVVIRLELAVQGGDLHGADAALKEEEEINSTGESSSVHRDQQQDRRDSIAYLEGGGEQRELELGSRFAGVE